MDRHQREAELHEMLTTQRGKEELLATLKQHAGMTEGNLPPFGTLLVEAILNYEFPPEQAGDLRPTEEAEPREPADQKLAEPGGQESLGG